jgi:hypothetical protein
MEFMRVPFVDGGLAGALGYQAGSAKLKMQNFGTRPPIYR